MRSYLHIFLFFTIFSLIHEKSLSNSVFLSDSIPSNDKKRAEIYLGGSIRELAHIGILFGDRTSFGAYLGYWPEYFSTGINIKTHFKGRVSFHDYSSYYLRFAIGMHFTQGYSWPSGPLGNPSSGTVEWNPPEPELIYLAITFGKNFLLNNNIGFSLDGGIMLVPISSEYIRIPIRPAISIKLYFNAVTKQKI